MDLTDSYRDHCGTSDEKECRENPDFLMDIFNPFKETGWSQLCAVLWEERGITKLRDSVGVRWNSEHGHGDDVVHG
jgi:hypothetical protein